VFKKLALALGFACILTVAWLWCFGSGPWNLDGEMLNHGRYAVEIADRWLGQSMGAPIAPISDVETVTTETRSAASEPAPIPPEPATDSPSPPPASPPANATAPAAPPSTDTVTPEATPSVATATVTPSPTGIPTRPVEIATTASVTTVWPGPDGSYIVQSGDTLDGIAARYGTTVDAILVASGLTRQQFIWLGQKLVIPGDWRKVVRLPQSTPEPAQPTVADVGGSAPSATTLSRPGSDRAVTSTATLSATIVYRDAPVVYTVKPGDYLAAIARRFGTSVEAIATLNQITNPSRITVGMTLTIPAVEFTPTAVPGGSFPP
jgi:LysM repeat protein